MEWKTLFWKLQDVNVSKVALRYQNTVYDIWAGLWGVRIRAKFLKFWKHYSFPLICICIEFGPSSPARAYESFCTAGKGWRSGQHPFCARWPVSHIKTSSKAPGHARMPNWWVIACSCRWFNPWRLINDDDGDDSWPKIMFSICFHFEVGKIRLDERISNLFSKLKSDKIWPLLAKKLSKTVKNWPNSQMCQISTVLGPRRGQILSHFIFEIRFGIPSSW